MDGTGPNRRDAQTWAAARAGRWQEFAAELRRRLGSGEPLGPGERERFERHLGVDLEAVMVHRVPLAGRIATALGADAFTAGRHVLGGGDRLDVDTPHGAALLGHELTHVTQQTVSHAIPSPVPSLAGGERSGPGAGQGVAIQRAVAEGGAEAAAQAVETEALASALSSARPAGGTVDVEALAERVYRKMVEILRLERERLGGLG
jgi:hypothetical protein